MNKVSIAFVDDHPILLVGLHRFFADLEQYAIVAEGRCAADAVKIARTARPDILLVDLNMPGDPYEAIGEITACCPGVKVVAFTAMASVDCAVRALEAGASGFLLKGSTAEELSQALRAVQEGESYITPAFATKVITALRTASRPPPPPEASRFNVREEQIVRLLLRGMTNKEIGHHLEISEKTVRHYMTLLMRKLNVRNRVEVVVAARQRGISN